MTPIDQRAREAKEEIYADLVKSNSSACNIEAIVLKYLAAQHAEDAAAGEKVRQLLTVAKCPNCNGEGWYVQAQRNTGEPEQVQCEWCHEKNTLAQPTQP